MVCSSTWLSDGSGSRESDTLALSVYLIQQKYAKLKHCNITFGRGARRCNCYTVLELHLFKEGILPENQDEPGLLLVQVAELGHTKMKYECRTERPSAGLRS